MWLCHENLQRRPGKTSCFKNQQMTNLALPRLFGQTADFMGKRLLLGKAEVLPKGVANQRGTTSSGAQPGQSPASYVEHYPRARSQRRPNVSKARS
jgi:hypothetical protein